MPFVPRVRFADIDLKKVGAVSVVVIELYKVADPATKRRSSVAAEDEDERLFSDAIM